MNRADNHAGDSWAIADDWVLLEAYRRRACSRSLEELVGRHSGDVRNLIYPMVLDADEANELTQETWLRAFQGLARFNGRSAFSTWLLRIAMNTTYTYLERKKRLPVTSLSDPLEPVDDVNEQPHDNLIKAELDAAIESALKSLTPKLRGAIVLTVMKGLSPVEAAKVEGCTAGTMYWRIHQARQLLQVRLGKWL